MKLNLQFDMMEKQGKEVYDRKHHRVYNEFIIIKLPFRNCVTAKNEFINIHYKKQENIL